MAGQARPGSFQNLTQTEPRPAGSPPARSHPPSCVRSAAGKWLMRWQAIPIPKFLTSRLSGSSFRANFRVWSWSWSIPQAKATAAFFFPRPPGPELRPLLRPACLPAFLSACLTAFQKPGVFYVPVLLTWPGLACFDLPRFLELLRIRTGPGSFQPFDQPVQPFSRTSCSGLGLGLRPLPFPHASSFSPSEEKDKKDQIIILFPPSFFGPGSARFACSLARSP